MEIKFILTLGLFIGFSASTAFAQAIEVTSTGVGIGTATPAQLLHLKGGNAWAVFERGSTSNVAIATFANAGNSPAWALGLVDSSNTFSMYNYGNSTTALSILASGKVGIGTTSPSHKLAVHDSYPIALHLKGNTSGHAPYVATYYIAESNSDPRGRGLFMPTATGESSSAWFAGVPYLGGGFQIGNSSVHATEAEGGAYEQAQARFFITTGGNVGIGTTSPSYKLHVNGTARASSFISDTTTYADFVFKPGYQLASLPEVEAAIQKNGHLPGIPSEAEARANGVDLAAMQVKLLQKVEELTLHLISHEKELRSLREETRSLPQLRSENESLRRRLSELESR